MTWADALDRFGTDKPDLRFGMELVDLSGGVRAHRGARLLRLASSRRCACPEGPRSPGRASTRWSSRPSGRRAAGLAWFRVTAAAGARAAGAGSPSIRRSTASCRSRAGGPPGEDRCGGGGPHPGSSRTRTGWPAPPWARCGRRSARPRSGRGRTATSGWSTSPCSTGSTPRGTRSRPIIPFTMPYPEDMPLLDTGPVRRALAGLRPGPQRVGAGIGQRPYPPARHPVADFRHAGHQQPRRRRPGSASSSAPSATAPRRMPASLSASIAWRRYWPGRRTSVR